MLHAPTTEKNKKEVHHSGRVTHSNGQGNDIFAVTKFGQISLPPMNKMSSVSTPPSQRQTHWTGWQQTYGNQAILRMTGRSQKAAAPIQTKLTVSQPRDVYEQEADRIADQVMRMPEPRIQRVCPECEEEEKKLQTKPLAKQITPLLQRRAEPMEEEEEGEMLQSKGTSGQLSTISPSLQNRITAFKGGGQPLPHSERAFFEPRFGADFSQVRIHADSQAAETASAVNSRAFTMGQDIVFGAGQYQQNASERRQLLAHELTHVVQQNSNVQTSLLQRWGWGEVQREIIQDEEPSEEIPLPSPHVVTEPLIGGGSRSYAVLPPSSAASEEAAQAAEAGLHWTFRRQNEGDGQQMNPEFWSVTYYLILGLLNHRLGSQEISISNEDGRTALQNVRRYLESLSMIRWEESDGYPISRIEFRLRSDVTPVAAARDLVNPRSAHHYAFECYTAAALIQFLGVWRSLQSTSSDFDETTFNRQYADFHVEHSEGASVHMGGVNIEGTLRGELGEFSLLELRYDSRERGLRRGDWVYLDNRHLITRGAFQGENATYLGNHRFHGHGIGRTGVFNLNQYVRNLRRRLPPQLRSLTTNDILALVRVRPFYRSYRHWQRFEESPS